MGEWITHYRKEPWGFEAEDMRNALLAATVMRAAGAKNVKVEQFRLRLPDPQPAEAKSQVARNVIAFFQPKVRRRTEGG